MLIESIRARSSWPRDLHHILRAVSTGPRTDLGGVTGTIALLSIFDDTLTTDSE